MKCSLIIMMFCFCCFAWDANENNTTKILDALYRDLAPDDTFLNPTLYNIVEDTNSSVKKSSDIQRFIYDGYETANSNYDSKRKVTNIGNYSNFYSGLMINDIIQYEPTRNDAKSPNEYNFSLPSFQQMDSRYQSYIKIFSKEDYYSNQYSDSNGDSSADLFLAKPDKFSIVEPIAEALNTETTDFKPNTLKNVEGMAKINTINTQIDFNLSQVYQNPLFNDLESDDIFGDDNFDGHTTFTLDLSALGTLWERLKAIVPNNPQSPQSREGGVNINPFRDWVFQIRIWPEQGDYLYPFFTWWRSSYPLPTAMRNCLKGIVYVVTFYMCFQYVKELWAK